MEFQRIIEKRLLDSCFKWKAIIIYWARQVWKTTLCKKLRWDRKDTLFVTWDDFSIVDFLNNISLTKLKDWLNGYSMVIIDEAQKIKNIGNTIKMIVDNIPNIQVVATWSSSFDLANNVQEPLTWRSKNFHLYPLSLEEIWWDMPLHEQKDSLEKRLIYWMYPRSVIANDVEELYDLVQAYVYKDVFLYEKLKKPDLIIKLLQALAMQIGSEVSYRELSQLLAVDVKTIQRYIMLLEQAFIIFRLHSFARNMRNELKRAQKIYFWDLWVRNWLLKNLSDVSVRTDIWWIWENFVISERLKYLWNHAQYTNSFFWRLTSWAEIDYIETDFSTTDAYEIKRSSKKNPKLSQSFADNYPSTNYTVIHPEDLYRWVS